jgi:hypothetical protein
MRVTKSSGGGAWLKKEDLKNGDVIKLVTEAAEVEGQNGPQLVAKCRVKGWEGEAMNLAINATSRNALIDAFGDDTKNWVNQPLTAAVERGIFAGKRGIMLNLVPEGFEITEDSGGFIVITRKGAQTTSQSTEDTREVPDIEVPF